MKNPKETYEITPKHPSNISRTHIRHLQDTIKYLQDTHLISSEHPTNISRTHINN